MSDQTISQPEDTQIARRAALYAALAKAQGSFKPIIPDRTVKVKCKDGSSYSFRYATLGAVIDAVREALSANGLALTCPVDPTAVRVQLCHEAGGVIECVAKAPACTDWQDFGSDLTYIRRYLVSSLLGVASEYDDDGNRSKGNEAVPDPEQADPFEHLWDALDKGGVSTESNERRAWCERVLGRPIARPDSLRDVDVAKLMAVAAGKEPMPPEVVKPTAEELAALNGALDVLAPWGSKGLDGLDTKQAAAKRKNAKLAWISAMVQPSRRVMSSAELSRDEVATLTKAALAGEMPAADALPAWMEGKVS